MHCGHVISDHATFRERWSSLSLLLRHQLAVSILHGHMVVQLMVLMVLLLLLLLLWLRLRLWPGLGMVLLLLLRLFGHGRLLRGKDRPRKTLLLRWRGLRRRVSNEGPVADPCTVSMGI